MIEITFPLEQGARGPIVKYLQKALMALSLEIDPRECRDGLFGDTTGRAVHAFQSMYGLNPTGAVDRATAEGIEIAWGNVAAFDEQLYEEKMLENLDAHTTKLTDIDGKLGDHTERLNEIKAGVGEQGAINKSLSSQGQKLDGIRTDLGEQGAISKSLSGQGQKLDGIRTDLGEQGAINKSLSDQGQKLDDIARTIGELGGFPQPTMPLSLGARGGQVKELQTALVDKLGFTISESEREIENQTAVFGVSTRKALLRLQARYGIALTGVLDDATKAALDRAKKDQELPKNRIEGRILLENGLPAQNLTVWAYDRGFGDAAKPVAIQTDEQGYYSLDYIPDGRVAHLQICVADPENPDHKIPLSDTKHQAGKHEVLNLVAPASAKQLDPECQRLIGALAKQLYGEDNPQNIEKIQKILVDVRENAERQDLTLLHQATGWDARLIALAATASKLNADTGMSQPALYALFRAGLPTDKKQLAHVSVGTVEKALRNASNAGIVDLEEQQIAEAKATFTELVRSTRRAAKPFGALSSFDTLLGNSELNDEQKDTFADLYLAHQGTAADLWAQAQVKGIPVDGLRLQGKLAYLTLNNADLVASLQQDIDSPDNLAQLVDQDLYRSEAWQERLKAVAGNDDQKLGKIIPPAYVGETTAERLDAYAADLARKVRLSFPTQVVRQMIAKDELHLGDRHDEVKKNVCTFLKNAQALGFELGRVPIDAFIKQHEDKIFEGINPSIEETVESVKLLQRNYQITPTNEALQVLLDLGFTSAYDVVAFPCDVFLDRFGHEFASREEARLVYRKAQQVSAVTYSFFGAAKNMDSAPGVYVMSPPAEDRENAKNELIKHYPTMESLFGSLDFCECEHCRSVLSPAAYLVDLLQFLDPDDLVWESFTDDWKVKHGGHAYDGPKYEYKKPCDALFKRRPDLPHLPLTCENTHTAMPYIDIVNEILEYYVANNNLDAGSVHDTGDATTAELLAEPQNIIPEAYESLKDARYPLSLPFDLWIETVRQFFDHFETPLWQVLEIFRPADELFAPDANPKPYYRVDIFAAYLNLSPDEYGIFTDPDPTDTWFELYGYETKDEALTALKSAKTLSRRLGVSYKELVDIVQAGFVNPALDDLSIVWKLGLDVSDVVRYLKDKDKPEYAAEKQAFEDRLNALLLETSSDLDLAGILAKLNGLQGGMQQALVLRDTSAQCNFDETYLEYADPADPNQPYAGELVFLKINLFVRLWKKLGWTIKETDRALQVFVPGNSLPLTGANIGQALKTALVYLAHLKALDEKVEVGRDSRIKLLTLWSNLDTTGKNPLYAQLFLTQSVLKNDPVFDDPLGDYLSQANPEPLENHLLAIQGALNLTADDIVLILDDAGQDIAAAKLTLDSVSLLYRYGLLAKALKLSVRELLALKALSGLTPLNGLSAGPIATLDDDYPFSQTLRFVEIAGKIKDSGFGIEDLDYLLRHRFDPVGKYRPNPDALPALVRLLAADIRRIQAEHAVPADAASISDDLMREKLALVLPLDVVETFLGFWKDTIEFSALVENVAENQKLDPATYTVNGIRVAYDATRQWQRAVHVGVLTDAKKADILNAVPEPGAHAPQNQKDAYANFVALLNEIAAQSQPQPEAFFDKYLGGFLAYDDLCGTAAAGLSVEEKRRKVLEAFLPFLQETLICQRVVQALATDLGSDPALTEALLTDARLLADPSHPSPPAAQPVALLNAWTEVAQAGITATFFASPDLTGNPLEAAKTVATIDLSAAPAGTNSALFQGYFEVPAAEAYRFYAVLGKANAEVEFHLSAQPDPLILHTAPQDDDEFSQFSELRSGLLYQFTLQARHLQGGSLAFLVSGETLPKDHLGQLVLYPQVLVDSVCRAHVLLTKVLQLIQGLALNEGEVTYLLTHAGDFDDLNLSKLPTHEDDDAPDRAKALFGQFFRLADYVRLRRDLAGGTDDLIDIFEHARCIHRASTDANQAEIAILQDLCQRIANLTRRDVAVTDEAAQQLGYAAQSAIVDDTLQVQALDFAQEKGIQRLWQILQAVQKLGVPVTSLALWATPAPDSSTARDLRNTIKARYEPENWQRIAPLIFDRLRQRQRDALVAYIMHKDGFERVEQLFEHFLIDPGMEPVVQTSRLRLAISCVQLFIQRCLLNLEPHVHPSAINSKHWQWMKRYRVWEANRKIFLFPENWLEPEFRDDKTHLFQELESTLLEGDVSNDLAEDAFFHYLKKLEELGRLDIVTMYCEEKPLDPASNTLHVVGRTYNLPHKYFYRRYAHQMWTPWEPVTAEIEGDHIAAVVWRERLHLFWVTFLEKAEDKSGGKITVDVSKPVPINTMVTKEVEIQLNWAEYFQGAWTTRESGGFGNPIIASVGSTFDSSKVFIHVYKEYQAGQERAVKINLGGAIYKAFRVVSKNGQPEIDDVAIVQLPPYSISHIQATQQVGLDIPLQVNFVERVETKDGYTTDVTLTTKDILRQEDSFSLLHCSNPQPFAWPDWLQGWPATMDLYFSPWLFLSLGGPKTLASPFFYQNNRHTFFVEPWLTETTIDRWDEYVIPGFTPGLEMDDRWRELVPIEPVVPIEPPLEAVPWEDPRVVDPIDPLAHYEIQPSLDWVTDPTTVFQFDEHLIGQGGGLDIVTTPAGAEGGASGSLLNTLPGGEMLSGGAWNVIGGGGMTPVLLENLNTWRDQNAGQGFSGGALGGGASIR